MGTVTPLPLDRDRLAEAASDRLAVQVYAAALRPDGPKLGRVWLSYAIDVMTRGTAPHSPERRAAVATAFQLAGVRL